MHTPILGGRNALICLLCFERGIYPMTCIEHFESYKWRSSTSECECLWQKSVKAAAHVGGPARPRRRWVQVSSGPKDRPILDFFMSRKMNEPSWVFHREIKVWRTADGADRRRLALMTSCRSRQSYCELRRIRMCCPNLICLQRVASTGGISFLLLKIQSLSHIEWVFMTLLKKGCFSKRSLCMPHSTDSCPRVVKRSSRDMCCPL